MGKPLIHQVKQLDVPWKNYVDLLRKQERQWDRSISIWEQDGAGYLVEARECRKAFEQFGCLVSMEPTDRALVGGWRTGYRYFGNMIGAGRYKAFVQKSPDLVDKLLDMIPLEGPVPDDAIVAFLEGFTRYPGVAITGTATRLLVAKRPDVFVPVTGANRDGIREVFGSSPASASGYLALLRQIWSFAWYKEPEPNDHRGVWRARAALVDAFVFAASR